MDKKERFNAAFNYLKDKGLIKTQKDLADRIGSTSPNVSSALKGVDSVLTDRFLERFCLAFSDVFNDGWILNGTGEMLKCVSPPLDTSEVSRLLSLLESTQETLRKRDEQIDRLISLLEKETERTQTIVSRAG